MIVPMEAPLSTTTAGEKLFVMTAEEVCANVVAAKNAPMNTAVTIGRHDDF